MEELQLRAGEWVEVRTREEILATLDADGMLDGMPFMPEMLPHCGRRLQVFRRADKTCDTISKTGNRRLERTVHLDTRCDGGAHGGCQAACLVFWKEAWLKRADVPDRGAAAATRGAGCTLVQLDASTRVPADEGVRYRCQVTQLVAASRPLNWWDPRQYWRDWRSGNVGLKRMARVLALATFNALQRWRGGVQYPRWPALTLKTTPSEHLGLQAGEVVQVKSFEEIVKTLDVRQKNRGLWFDSEMIPFCGGTYRVRQRVDQIINERTGQMMRLPNDCVILENVWCRGDFSSKRLLCPRSIYPYWREIWLRRVAAPAGNTVPGTDHAIAGHRS